uniref:Uncharacterized protein n=1 Tax=Solanum tuberosum TaxID=4113 RepID=M1BZG3_SOLTU
MWFTSSVLPFPLPLLPDSTLASPDSVTVPLAGTDLDTEEVFAVTACGTLDPCGTRERFPVVVEGGVEVSLVRLSSTGHASEAPLSVLRGGDNTLLARSDCSLLRFP